MANEETRLKDLMQEILDPLNSTRAAPILAPSCRPGRQAWRAAADSPPACRAISSRRSASECRAT